MAIFSLGKFDQLHRNILQGVVAPFRELINQLLSESDDNLKQWKNRMLAALGPNCQVMIDVIPEVELIVGPQSPVPELEPIEALNRFRLVFQDFIRVFCRPGHPLVIFLRRCSMGGQFLSPVVRIDYDRPRDTISPFNRFFPR